MRLCRLCGTHHMKKKIKKQNMPRMRKPSTDGNPREPPFCIDLKPCHLIPSLLSKFVKIACIPIINTDIVFPVSARFYRRVQRQSATTAQTRVR